MGGRSERCRRLVRHTLRRDIGYPEPYRARLTPRSPIRGALWRQDYLAKAIGAIDEFACRVRVSLLSPRFTTIQVYPKDLQALPVHPEPAVSWHSGFRGGAHARHKTTPDHHAAWWGRRLAARGARAAAGDVGGWVSPQHLARRRRS